MERPQLYLVDRNGVSATPAVDDAVHSAYRRAVRAYPAVDPALIANWAEEVAVMMIETDEPIRQHDRLAYTLLATKIKGGARRKSAQEVNKGIGEELEDLSRDHVTIKEDVERSILFDQLQAGLSERDQAILALVRSGEGSAQAVAKKFNIGEEAAAKAIQRMRERVAALLAKDRRGSAPGTQFCGTEG